MLIDDLAFSSSFLHLFVLVISMLDCTLDDIYWA